MKLGCEYMERFYVPVQYDIHVFVCDLPGIYIFPIVHLPSPYPPKAPHSRVRPVNAEISDYPFNSGVLHGTSRARATWNKKVALEHLGSRYLVIFPSTQLENGRTEDEEPSARVERGHVDLGSARGSGSSNGSASWDNGSAALEVHELCILHSNLVGTL